jgi:peptidoglycan hydrolase-like protein with peptidoglycan-binding domain
LGHCSQNGAHGVDRRTSYDSLEEQRRYEVRFNHGMMRFAVLGIAIGIAVAGSVSADENPRAGWAEQNVRIVQEKLREAGLYFGEIDGAYSSELAAALGRYQIRNGLPITGQLDEETGKALSAKPAVTITANDRAKSSETWRRLRAGEQRTPNNARVTPLPGVEPSQARVTSAQNSPAATDTTMQPETPSVSSPSTNSSAVNISKERLRDYVGAFVLAGLDPHIGSETDFFADRVQYYDQGVFGREKIHKDLQRYATQWPDRRFWLDGDITVDGQNGNRVQVTFPLRYDLRNGTKHSSGRINKTLVLEPAGNDFQIVAVNERRAG